MTVLDDVKATPIDQLGRPLVMLSNGDTVSAGALSINQVAALVRVVGGALSAATNKDVETAVQGRDWMALVSLFSAETITEALQVVTGRTLDADTFTLPDLVRVGQAVWDGNDPDLIKSVFTRAASRPSTELSGKSSEPVH